MGAQSRRETPTERRGRLTVLPGGRSWRAAPTSSQADLVLMELPSPESPSMARLFRPDGDWVPEAAPFAHSDLLALEPDSLLPQWWPIIHEGIRWTPRQRTDIFEATLRHCVPPREARSRDELEPRHILRALRLLRSVVPPE